MEADDSAGQIGNPITHSPGEMKQGDHEITFLTIGR